MVPAAAPSAWGGPLSASHFRPARSTLARGRWLSPSHGPADQPRRALGDGQWKAEQQMIDLHAGIPAIGVSEVIPECVDPLAGMELAEGVGPTLSYEARV